MKIVLEYLNKGVFKKDNGAVIFPGEDYGLHTRVFINSKGLPTYEAKELGLAPKKFKDSPYDLSIIVTGNEIDDYFKVLIKALEQIHPELANKTVHLSHGMMRLKGLGKMSSRTGKVITGEGLIETVEKKLHTVLKSKTDLETEAEFMYPKSSNLNGGENFNLPLSIAISAIKFSILKVSLGKNIEFDLDESINIQGFSGPYVQYTHARANSVLEKSGNSISSLKDLQVENINFNKDEEELVRILFKFTEEVEKATTELSPHYICHYLFLLCQTFNRFYNSTKIIGEPNESQRLLLTASTMQVIKNGLTLLGIHAPEKM